ncbi:MAG: hypothetical protein ACOYOV_09800 [Bacteroidales bacterium]
MLTAEKFERLSVIDKLTVIFEDGEELYLRTTKEGFSIKLYQLNDFFCEVWYSSEANKVYKIELIDPTQIVGLYDINIDFKDLMNQ